MKRNKYLLLLLLLGPILAPALSAQIFDDLYYNPDQDTQYNSYQSEGEYYADNYEDEYAYQDYDYEYERDEYDYYNDYDFYYTSRIRRFHRPVYGFSYYDPVYTDSYYYDPMLRGGTTVLIYDDFSYRSWARNRAWSRLNRWAIPGKNFTIKFKRKRLRPGRARQELLKLWEPFRDKLLTPRPDL